MLAHWDDATAPDLHQVFGIDVDDPATEQRSWHWCYHRILALLDLPTARITRTLSEVTNGRSN